PTLSPAAHQSEHAPSAHYDPPRSYLLTLPVPFVDLLLASHQALPAAPPPLASHNSARPEWAAASSPASCDSTAANAGSSGSLHGRGTTSDGHHWPDTLAMASSAHRPASYACQSAPSRPRPSLLQSNAQTTPPH